MRVVLDTNVVVAGIRSPDGASAEILAAVIEGRLEAACTIALALEAESVCLRHDTLVAAGGDAGQVRRFLDAYFGSLVPVDIWYSWRPQTRDPNDDHVVDAAMNGFAQGIVTFNVRDFMGVDRLGLEILSPRAALKKLVR